MTKKRKLLKAAVTCAKLLLLLLVLAVLSGDLVFARLITGFYFFLRDNLPAMSFNAATWGPGLGAFLLALFIGHVFFARWAARTNRHWTFRTSLCLALVVPVLFVISLLVPGVLLQWEVLRETHWVEIR